MADLAAALKVLSGSRVRKGEPAESAARSDRMNAIIDAILGLARGDNIGRGVGIRKRVGENTFILSVDARSSRSGGANDPDIAFFLSNATTSEGDPPEESNKVEVADGKINGQFPSGMGGPGSDPFILDITDPADCIIYAEITFNAESLEITSREINQSPAGSIPESGIDGGTGSFIVMLGFTFFDSDDEWRIINTHLGNIDFVISYASNLGKPALVALPAYSPYMDIPEE